MRTIEGAVIIRAKPGTLCCLVMVMGITAAVEARSQDLGDDTVVVRQTVATQYERDLPNFETLLEAAGESVSPVRAGDSLSAILARNYGVSAASAPGTYERLEAFVVEANALADADSVRAGQDLKLPEVPPMALARPNPGNPLNAVPKIALNARLSEALADGGGRYGDLTEPLAVRDDGRLGSQSTVVLRAVSPGEAEEIAAADETSQFDLGLTEIQFEATDESVSGDSRWLDDAAFLRGHLTGPTQQSPVLIILDDAWPTDRAFVESREFFARSLDELRAYWRITDQRFSSGLMNSTAAAWIGQSGPPRFHATDIQEALQPLTALTPAGGPVRVIYLPMFVRQRGAAEVLEGLIAFDLTLQYRQTDPLNPTPPDTVRTARQLAGKAVERLERASGPAWRRTDFAVIQAALAFCEHYSNISKNACFVNMSWTTPGDWYRPRVPSDGYGMAVAAAGNEGSSDQSLYLLKRQFAMRSATPPGDVLAVVNIDDRGQLTCNSTTLEGVDTPILAVAYSGHIDAGRCGTSFAAPRVAWLYAAREAFRPAPVDPAAWRRAFWREVTRAASEGTGDSYEPMRVNVRTLFESQ